MILFLWDTVCKNTVRPPEVCKKNGSRRLHRWYFEPNIIILSQSNTVYVAWIRKVSVHNANKAEGHAPYPGHASSTCTQHPGVSILLKEDGFKVPEMRVPLNCERHNQHVYSVPRGKFASKERRVQNSRDARHPELRATQSARVLSLQR